MNFIKKSPHNIYKVEFIKIKPKYIQHDKFLKTCPYWNYYNLNFKIRTIVYFKFLYDFKLMLIVQK